MWRANYNTLYGSITCHPRCWENSFQTHALSCKTTKSLITHCLSYSRWNIPSILSIINLFYYYFWSPLNNLIVFFLQRKRCFKKSVTAMLSSFCITMKADICCTISLAHFWWLISPKWVLAKVILFPFKRPSPNSGSLNLLKHLKTFAFFKKD